MATGTKVADVYVDLGLALTQYRKDLATAKGEAASVGAQIRSALAGGAGPAGGYTSGFAKVIQELKSGSGLVTALRGNVGGLTKDLAKVSVGALENGLKRVLTGIKSVGSSLAKGFLVGTGIGAFLGIEQVISRIVSAIPDLISKGREYAETVHAITLETGASAEVASKTLAIYQFFGGTTAQFETQLVRLSARVKSQEQSFNELGVATRDVNGNFLGQIDILNNVRDAFQRVGDGTGKTGFLFRAFGQRGAQALEPLIHFIGATDQQMQQLGLHVTEQGLVLTDAQVKIADAVSRAQNNLGNAITGFATRLFLSFGPTLTTFFDGLADTVTRNADKIEEAIGGILGTIVGLVEGLTGMSTATESFSSGFAHVNETGGQTSDTLVSLNQQLVDLEAKLNPVADAADAVNASLKAQIATIQREIEVLKEQDAAQRRVFDRQIAGLARVYQLRLDALALGDRERAALAAERDLNEQLNQAQLDLREALAGKAGVVDAEAVSKAMAQVADIQRRQAELVRQQQEDAQVASLQSTRDYIESIGQMVDKADNDRALLKNLNTRKATLEGQLAAAQEIGDAQKVADVKAKLAAVEQGIGAETAKIKNQTKTDELIAKQKALQDATVTTAQINKQALLAQIDDTQALIDKEKTRLAFSEHNAARQHALHGQEFDDIGMIGTATDGVAGSVTGKGGLVEAMDTARQHGIDMAKDWHDALVGKDGKGGLLGAVGSIAAAIGGLGQNVQSFAPILADLVTLAKLGVGIPGLLVSLPTNIAGDTGASAKTGAGQKDIDYLRKQNPLAPYDFGTFGTYGGVLRPGMTNRQAIAALIAAGYGHAMGGWVGERGPQVGVFGDRGREYVLDNALSEKLNRFFSIPQVPAYAMAGGGTLVVERLTVDLGNGKLVDLVGQEIEYRRRR